MNILFENFGQFHTLQVIILCLLVSIYRNTLLLKPLLFKIRNTRPSPIFLIPKLADGKVTNCRMKKLTFIDLNIKVLKTYVYIQYKTMKAYALFHDICEINWAMQ